MTSANGYEVIGKGGQLLSDKWSQGVRTYLSYNVRGFPNFWILNGPQGVLTTSFVAQLEWCAQHAAFMIKKMEAEGIRAVEPKQAAEDAYCAKIYETSTQNFIP